MSSSLRVFFQEFSSFAFPHCGIQSVTDRSDDEEDGRGKREKGCNEAIERMIISISILVILLPSKISPTLILKNYCYALKNYPSFPSRIDI